MFRVLLSPRLVGVHLLAVAAATVAALLGLWQYDAWQAHREAQAADLAHAAPKQLSEVMSADDPFPADGVGRPVNFTGEWVGDTTFVVSRDLGGRDGAWVVTPVAVCGTSCGPDRPAMLVVRGWTPDPRTVPSAPTGSVDVTGWLQPSEGSGRPDPDPTDDVLPEVRIADAVQHVDQDLYGGYVIAQDPTAGLEPVTPDSLPEPDTFTAVRNLLYALEWWVFGGFAVFVWWRFCSDEVRRARSVTSEPADEPSTDDSEVASRT